MMLIRLYKLLFVKPYILNSIKNDPKSLIKEFLLHGSPDYANKIFNIIDPEWNIASMIVKCNMEYWEDIIAKIKDKDIILLVGRTQGGKSTISNLLIGKKLTLIKNNAYSFSTKNINVEESNIKIGRGGSSETSLPNIYEHQGQLYVDCPGFGDTRGILSKIVNGLGIQHLVASAKSTKIVAIIPENDCKNKWDPLLGKKFVIKQLIIDLADFFVSPEDIKKMSVIISKAGKYTKGKNIQELIGLIKADYIRKKFLDSESQSRNIEDNDFSL